MKKGINLGYGCIHGTYWMHYGVLVSFASAFLLARGYSNSEIGIILAAGSVGAVFIQPILADISDRSKKIGIFGLSQCITVIMMVFTLGLFIIEKKSMGLLIIFVALIAWITVLQPLFNALPDKFAQRGIEINFGFGRSIGSLAYSVICSVLGGLVEEKGVEILPLTGEVVLALLLISIYLVKRQYDKLENTKANEKLEENAVKIDDEEINLLMFVKRNKLFFAMNIGVAGVYFSNAILNNFMLQVVTDVGGDSKDLGMILSVMAFLEIPALLCFDAVRKRFSCQKIIKFAALCFCIKIFLIFMAKSVSMIYIAHVFQAFSFGLFLPAMVRFTGEVMSRGEAVKGQALYTIMITISTVFASLMGGIIIDAQGVKSLLLYGTAATFIGFLMIFCIVDKIIKKN